MGSCDAMIHHHVIGWFHIEAQLAGFDVTLQTVLM